MCDDWCYMCFIWPRACAPAGPVAAAAAVAAAVAAATGLADEMGREVALCSGFGGPCDMASRRMFGEDENKEGRRL